MRRFLIPCLALLTLCLVSACAQSQYATSAAPADQSAPPPPPQEPTAFYYDFDDILIPKEMDLKAADSFILETPQFKSGVMVFSGKIEVNSLTDFFIANMTKDNWSMRSAFRSSRTILVFEKAQRYCIINITDEKFKTLVEIWVSPFTGDSAGMGGWGGSGSGRSKSTGEKGLVK